MAGKYALFKGFRGFKKLNLNSICYNIGMRIN